MSLDSASPAYPSRGSVLVVALLITAMIALTLGSYLSLNLSSSRLARSSYQQNAAFHLAEAGAEEAVWSLNRTQAQAPDAWNGWSTQGAAAWRKFAGFDLGAGATGSVKVYVNNSSPSATDKPLAVALATVVASGVPASSRMIELTLGRRSYFSSGIVARETVRFAGTNATVDSWNSDPDQDPSTPPVPYGPDVRNDQGSVATMAVQNNAMLVNHAAVWGHVATGGAAPEVGVNGSILGADSAPDVKIDPTRVTTDFAADLPLLTAPLDGTPLASLGATLGMEGTATRWRCNSVALHGSQTLTILGDVTLILTTTVGSALDVTGNASIIIPEGSSLTVYAEADIKIAGNGLANANRRPSSCKIYGTSSSPAGQTIHIAGNGAIKAAIYAPNGDIQINGNGDVMGSLVGREVTFTGNANFHYDESLASEGEGGPFKVTRWRELSSQADRALWQPVFAGW
jgi:Tfp pilus assembly protein PilX